MTDLMIILNILWIKLKSVKNRSTIIKDFISNQKLSLNTHSRENQLFVPDIFLLIK